MPLLPTANDKTIFIDGTPIGPGHPPYIVAELSANHNGSLEHALALIEAAKNAGANAVKIQTYRPDTLTIDCNRPDFQINQGLWQGKNLYQLYEWAHTPWEWHAALFQKAQAVGITLFSSPFDASAVELLESLNAPAYKIASFELIDHALIKCVAKTGKPLILSTGMADQTEIAEAVTVARANGCTELMLLQCVSGYPAPASDYNLRTLADMASRFDCLVGLSDHTLCSATAITSIALNACLIEKHFTLSREEPSPDAAFSLEPHELADLCTSAKTAWSALGQANYQRRPSEEANLVFRRSLYVVEDMQAGDVFSAENLRSIRPGYGLAPKHLTAIIGQRAAKPIKAGTRMDWSMTTNNEDPQ
jgi:N-acetylneuraminate synthase